MHHPSLFLFSPMGIPITLWTNNFRSKVFEGTLHSNSNHSLIKITRWAFHALFRRGGESKPHQLVRRLSLGHPHEAYAFLLDMCSDPSALTEGNADIFYCKRISLLKRISTGTSFIHSFFHVILPNVLSPFLSWFPPPTASIKQWGEGEFANL